MAFRAPPELDMTPEGEFRSPPGIGGAPLLTRIAGIALVVAVLGALAAGALLALWLALFLIPVIFAAGVIGWAALRFQLWRQGRSFGGNRDVFRP